MIQRFASSRLRRANRDANQGAFLADAATNDFTPAVAVTVIVVAADVRTAGLLGILPADEVLVRDRLMSADGVPVMHARSALPRFITKGTAMEQENTGPGGLYARMEEAGHTLTPAVERITTRKATAADAALIRVEVGDPVLCVTRVARSTTGLVVEVNDMVLVGDRYELIYEVPVD